MNITNLPSLTDLLNQNPNIQPNVQANRFVQSSELSQLNQLGRAPATNGIEPVVIDKTTPTERVTAPDLLKCLRISLKVWTRKRRFPSKKLKT